MSHYSYLVHREWLSLGMTGVSGILFAIIQNCHFRSHRRILLNLCARG